MDTERICRKCGQLSLDVYRRSDRREPTICAPCERAAAARLWLERQKRWWRIEIERGTYDRVKLAAKARGMSVREFVTESLRATVGDTEWALDSVGRDGYNLSE